MKDLFGIIEDNKKSYKINDVNGSFWVGEHLFKPEITDPHLKKYTESEGYINNILTNTRFKLLLALILVIMGVLFARAAQLQIIEGEGYKKIADSNRLDSVDLRSDRGLIYDRNYVPLVRNVPNYTVEVIPRELTAKQVERQEMIKSLYRKFLINYTELSLNDFVDYIESLRMDTAKYDKEIIIANHLKKDHAILLQIEAKNIPGVYMRIQPEREYSNEGPVLNNKETDFTKQYEPVKSISHILGYLTYLNEGEFEANRKFGYLYNDLIGRVGLESEYEKVLRGQYGTQQIEKDAFGNSIQIVANEPAIDGKSLLTSLDIELQREAERILRDNIEKNDLNSGSIVIVNPNNGEILALVSFPMYDNNVFAKGEDQNTIMGLIRDENKPLYNRAISGEYPSGSTFKPIISAAALQEGIITPNTTFLSTGGIQINQWFFPDWKAGGHGITNLYYALEDSVNTYFYIIGGGYQQTQGLGVEKIVSYAKLFGLSEKLGIDIPGERSGFLPSKEWKETIKNEKWYIGDTYHIAIGQGDLLVTPLQMAMVASVFANGGTLYKPKIVKAYMDDNQIITEEFSPTIIRQGFIDNVYLDAVNIGLRRVVTAGSGRRLSALPFDVAGKTGTAQWHSEKDPHAWFIGYAPYQSPEIAFSIMIEEGKEGSEIAVTIANQLLYWWNLNTTK